MRNEGKVVVLATHDVELAARISDEVILLINGKVIAKGLARGILTREDLLELADTEPPITYRIWETVSKLISSTATNERPITLRELMTIIRKYSNLREGCDSCNNNRV